MRLGPILDRDFYSRPTVDVARALLGQVLVHGSTAGRIVETEAYLGAEDLASHASRGVTKRTAVVFGPPGHAYVYLVYGMYCCLNLVAEPEGTPGCVLIRALQPVAGLDEMRLRRKTARHDRDLASGPGKLTLALGISLAQNGADVTRGPLTVHSGPALSAAGIEAAPRVGIRHCTDWPLRFLARL
jgi:DNA-3-methyladenine glycosylase